jgi:hypothetical protein
MYEGMRRIANKYISDYSKNPCIVFYEQAKLVESFTENTNYLEKYTSDTMIEIGFKRFFSTYEEMSIEQLKCYFSWRSDIRKNLFPKARLSYIYIHANELINKIGVEDSDDGLNKLTNLWKAYRFEYKNLDNYFPEWIYDYNIVHGCNTENLKIVKDLFSEFEKSGTLPSRWLAGEVIITYFTNNNYCIPQQILEKISNYRFNQNAFFKSEQGHLILEILPHVFSEIEKSKSQNSNSTLIEILEKEMKAQSWRPFRSSSFYSEAFSDNQECILSDSIEFCNQNEKWYSTYPHENFLIISKYVGEIIKSTESAIREEMHFRRQLNIEKIDNSIKATSKSVVIRFLNENKLRSSLNRRENKDGLKISIKNRNVGNEIIFDPIKLNKTRSNALLIKNEVPLEYDCHIIEKSKHLNFSKKIMCEKSGITAEKINSNKKVSSVKNNEINVMFDTSLFEKIRKDSTDIQEKLITENENMLQEPTLNLKSELLTKTTHEEIAIASGNGESESEWIQFYEALTEANSNALKVLIDKDNIEKKLAEVAKEQGVLLEVLMESINEIALEYLGDNVLDTCGIPPSIYQEYEYQVKNIFMEV